MKYVEQDYQYLRLILTEQKLPEDKFSLVSKTSYSNNKIDIEFGILAESHFVTIQTKKVIFTEICACSNVSIENVQTNKLTDIGSKTQLIETEAYHYEFMCEKTSTKTGAVKLKALQKNRSHPGCQYLNHSFPGTQTEPSALTEIHITIDKDLIIESVHSYPNDNIMVFTTSVLTFKK